MLNIVNVKRLQIAAVMISLAGAEVSVASATYEESFFCGCRLDAKTNNTVDCPPYPSESLRSGTFEWLKLVPLAVGGEGVCTGSGAPADCDRGLLERELNEDLYNWLPVTADTYEDIEGRVFMTIPTELTPLSCDLELDNSRPIIDPPDHLKGDIARRILYLTYRYNVRVPDRYLQMLLSWDASDPVSARELRIAIRIGKLQNSTNAFVTSRTVKD